MEATVLIEILMKLVGGLGIFLLGMKHMSEGMQAVAGNRLRSLIGAVTNNRVMACLVGTAVTCLIQSSSVTTVMVVGFVNSGFMTLMQAIGVIIGANIGTTITGWILVFKIGKWGLPILGVAAFFYLFSKRERLRFTSMAIMGIGMVFFGLETMSSGFKNEAVTAVLEHIFAMMHAGTYPGMLKCAAVGCIATMIVQSSSATLGVTIALGMTGTMDFSTGAALILGLNIGTTITAFLASLGASTNAKRAAYAHILFNIIGTLWLLPFFPKYVELVEGIVNVLKPGGEAVQVLTTKLALAHTCFNVINTILFLPFTGVLSRVVTWLVKEKRKEIPHLTYLDVRMLETPAIAIQQSLDEVNRMGEHVTKMLDTLRSIMVSETVDEELVKKVFHREEVLDLVQKEVTEFLDHVLSGNLPHDVVEASHRQLRIADEYESISDYLATILKLHLKKEKAGLKFSVVEREGMLKLHAQATEYVAMVTGGVGEGAVEILSKARSQGQALTHVVKELRTAHLEATGTVGGSPLASLIFTDMLNAYRRVKDHALNIAEALAGEK